MNRTVCPKFLTAMQFIAKRWMFLIVHQLLQGPKRFCEIEAALPISARLLTERLKELEKSGIVQRKVYPDSPNRVEYSLTEKGLALTPAIRELEKWAQRFVEIENFSQESPITTVEKGRGKNKQVP